MIRFSINNESVIFLPYEMKNLNVSESIRIVVDESRLIIALLFLGNKW